MQFSLHVNKMNCCCCFTKYLLRQNLLLNQVYLGTYGDSIVPSEYRKTSFFMQDEPTKCYNMLHDWSISHDNIYTEVVCKCEKFILSNKWRSFAVFLRSTL